MTSPPIDAATATEMRRIDNSSACAISPVKIALGYKGHLLTKDDGTYTTWARDFENELVMNGLWEYAFDPPLRPDEVYEPRAYRNWAHNDRLICAFIATGVASSEQQFMPKEGAKACWLAIRGRHKGSGPVQQVRLLQEALSTKCSLDTPLTETIDSIFEKIDRAFAVGKVSSDTLKCIACLSSLSDKAFAHARSSDPTFPVTSLQPPERSPTNRLTSAVTSRTSRPSSTEIKLTPPPLPSSQNHTPTAEGISHAPNACYADALPKAT
ncbi:hypothetical protein D9615_008559 [Tricholomella constricta]|uniref:Uncharacterized protein n=1 Tax=Tricholomella constricta TaxID=117010 RepID=A0A8H5M0G2_9AGAR|nr:hypothetical protein D9615_008559 [Tricholomella constricta]